MYRRKPDLRPASRAKARLLTRERISGVTFMVRMTDQR